MTTLASLTTLRVDGPITKHVCVSTTDALADTVATVDTAGGPFLAVDGGLNLLASDALFEGTVANM